MAPTVSFVVATYNRRDDLVDCLDAILDQSYDDFEVVIVSNSTDGTSDLFSTGGRFDRNKVRYYYESGRMGVAGARNRGFELAEGDVIVCVDDDAVLEDTGATERIVERFEGNPDLGALAFRSRNSETGETKSAELPHSGDHRSADESFETTYFVGVGHAIRASVLEEVGGYPEFEYGFEELDLSFRLLEAGYRIRYCPDVVVEHKNVTAGRYDSNEVLRWRLENRTRIALRYLPWRHVLVSTIIWTAYVLLSARLWPMPVLQALWAVMTDLPTEISRREVLSAETIAYLRRHGGRLYY